MGTGPGGVTIPFAVDKAMKQKDEDWHKKAQEALDKFEDESDSEAEIEPAVENEASNESSSSDSSSSSSSDTDDKT